jgi:signal transduction histidine kinase/CheY-like chemotaxis protein
VRRPHLSNVPIRRKLTAIIALASSVALVTSSAAFLLYDRSSVERTMARRLHGEAEIVAFNSATALVFRDPDSAVKTMAALASDPHVMSAAIYLPDGRPFAQYARPGVPPGAGAFPPPGPEQRFEEDALVLTRPILFEGRPIGTLVLRSDLAERAERFNTYALIVAVVSLAALGAALGVGRLAQRAVAQPILDLAQASHHIAEQGDFSLRMETRGRDEVGTLVAAFNRMLEGLQHRDQELKRTHAELLHRIQEADEANRLKDEFLATLSHELRTPLNAILGWAQMLRTGLDPATTTQALDSIARNALTQSRLVGDILDMQRIAAGKLRLNLQALDLAPVIRRAVDTVSPAARAKEIEIQQVLDHDAGPVLGDEDRLQQVMWNLLSNAVKFAPRGGRVRTGLARVDSHVEITVEDTGPGLDPAFIPFAFDRFRQADSSTTRRHGGLGLGLAIVRHLVELHGGSVAAENRSVGTGALFVIKLPRMSVRTLARGPGTETPHPGMDGELPMEAAPHLDGIRVLVVDDERDARELISASLSACGADVASAASAAEALEVLSRYPPHVLVSDIEMPGEDGYALLKRLRQLPRDRGGLTPAVALTAYAGAEDRMRALLAGFQVHLPKPVQPAELAAVVASLTASRMAGH